MHPILEINKFPEPNYLKRIHENVAIENMTVTRHGDKFVLGTEQGLWMTYRFDNQEEALELYSHYKFASGHCVCTGLGLGIRESWLLTKPNVTKITVIEKNKSVIDFHRSFNPELLERIEVINAEARSVKMSCDTLLPDHYSKEGMDMMMFDVEEICRNISCETMWFWPLEECILERSKAREYHGYYMNLKTSRFPRLPDITAQELYFILACWYPTYASREVEGN
jgi:hypothetical protein